MTKQDVDRGRLYRVPVAAAMLDVSRSTVYRAIAAGAVPAVRIGSRSVRIHGTTLASLLEAGLPQTPTPDASALAAAS